jgi:GGDEF domain-containing protein
VANAKAANKTIWRGRIGGDEFLLIITHAQEWGVKLAVERLRQQVNSQRLRFGDYQLGVTASFGIAGLQRGPNLDFRRLNRPGRCRFTFRKTARPK